MAVHANTLPHHLQATIHLSFIGKKRQLKRHLQKRAMIQKMQPHGEMLSCVLLLLLGLRLLLLALALLPGLALLLLQLSLLLH